MVLLCPLFVPIAAQVSTCVLWFAPSVESAAGIISEMELFCSLPEKSLADYLGVGGVMVRCRG